MDSFIKQYVKIDIEDSLGRAISKFSPEFFAIILSNAIWHNSSVPETVAKEIIKKMEEIIKEESLDTN